MTSIRFKVQNLNFATGWKMDRDNLDHLAAEPADRPVILFLQEAKNLRGRHTLSSILGKLWHGLTGKTVPTAGTGIYARGVKVLGLHQWLLGKFRDTLPRWATQGRVRVRNGVVRVISAHIPPQRSGKADQHAALDRLIPRVRNWQRKGRGWVIAADWNIPLIEAAAYFQSHGISCRVYGENDGKGIVGFLVSLNVAVSAHGQDTYGLHHADGKQLPAHANVEAGDTDHPSEWIDVDGLTA